MISDDLRREIRNLLQDIYGNRLKGVVLFGSEVNGNSTVDSDIDALVFFDRSDLADSSPTQLRTLLADLMRERYGDDNIFIGNFY